MVRMEASVVSVGGLPLISGATVVLSDKRILFCGKRAQHLWA